MRQGNGQDNGAGWIDTHVHMDDARFADAQAVRRAARAEGVARLVIPAIGPVNFHTVRDLAQEWGDAYALGIHPMYLPHDVDAALAALEAALEQCRNDPHLVAIGEIGLDFYEPHLCTPAMRVIQENCFAAQLRLAQRFDLPVLLHVRQSVDAVLKYVRQLPPPGGIAAPEQPRQQATPSPTPGLPAGVRQPRGTAQPSNTSPQPGEPVGDQVAAADHAGRLSGVIPRRGRRPPRALRRRAPSP